MSDSMKLMIKSDEVYNILKYVAQIVLPGLGTLYFALSQIWGLPYGTEIVGTIVAIDAFLGLMLGISTSQYRASDLRFDGTIDVVESPDATRFSLSLDDSPYSLVDKDEVVFRVVTTTDDP